MKVGILAVQGDFAEHEKIAIEFGADIVELRQASDAKKEYDFLFLPGGESTVQRKLLKDLGMSQILSDRINEGIPVFATCAGLILLADFFETLPVTVQRNAYGRQTGSFYTESSFGDLENVQMTFIRAPVISGIKSPDVQVLATVDNNIVAVRYKNQLGMSFHPELNSDRRIYDYFFNKI